MSSSRPTCPPSLGSTPPPFTTLSTPGCEMVRDELVFPKPLRESAVKPGCLDWAGCPNSDGCEERALLLKLPTLVPTFVIRGNAGAESDGFWPKELGAPLVGVIPEVRAGGED